MSVKISVQICSYNRWSLLKRALEALFVQDFPKDHYEIVLVDYENNLQFAQDKSTAGSGREFS